MDRQRAVGTVPMEQRFVAIGTIVSLDIVTVSNVQKCWFLSLYQSSGYLIHQRTLSRKALNSMEVLNGF